MAFNVLTSQSNDSRIILCEPQPPEELSPMRQKIEHDLLDNGSAVFVRNEDSGQYTTCITVRDRIVTVVETATNILTPKEDGPTGEISAVVYYQREDGKLVRSGELNASVSPIQKSFEISRHIDRNTIITQALRTLENGGKIKNLSSSTINTGCPLVITSLKALVAACLTDAPPIEYGYDEQRKKSTITNETGIAPTPDNNDLKLACHMLEMIEKTQDIVSNHFPFTPNDWIMHRRIDNIKKDLKDYTIALASSVSTLITDPDILFWKHPTPSP